MADHLAGWQIFQFTVGKLLFSFCSFLLLLAQSRKTYVPDYIENQRRIGNTACLFYNYDFISFPNCTGNVKCLLWHSSIIVGSLFMCLVYSSSLYALHNLHLLHDNVALSWEERKVCILLRSPTCFCSWSVDQFCYQFYLFLYTCSGKQLSTKLLGMLIRKHIGCK